MSFTREKIDDEFECHLCCEPMLMTTRYPCKHRVCANCAALNVVFRPTCPFCRRPVGKKLKRDSDFELLVKKNLDSKGYSCDTCAATFPASGAADGELGPMLPLRRPPGVIHHKCPDTNTLHVSHKPTSLREWMELIVVVPKEQVIFVEGGGFSRLELCIYCVTSYATTSRAWITLANELLPKDIVSVDGRSVTRLGCLIKAIMCQAAPEAKQATATSTATRTAAGIATPSRSRGPSASGVSKPSAALVVDKVPASTWLALAVALDDDTAADVDVGVAERKWFTVPFCVRKAIEVYTPNDASNPSPSRFWYTVALCLRNSANAPVSLAEEVTSEPQVPTGTSGGVRSRPPTASSTLSSKGVKRATVCRVATLQSKRTPTSTLVPATKATGTKKTAAPLPTSSSAASVTMKSALLRAIEADAGNASAWDALALELEKGKEDEVTVKGKVYSREMCIECARQTSSSSALCRLTAATILKA